MTENPDLERLLKINQGFAESYRYHNLDTPELEQEYNQLKEKIEKALEPNGTLKAYMKMWKDVVEQRDRLLQSQKKALEIEDKIRDPNLLNYIVGKVMSSTKGQVNPDDMMRVLKQELQSILGEKK